MLLLYSIYAWKSKAGTFFICVSVLFVKIPEKRKCTKCLGDISQVLDKVSRLLNDNHASVLQFCFPQLRSHVR